MDNSFQFGSRFRQAAMKLRHAPGLRHATPFWNLLRGPYRRVLAAVAGSRGIPVSVAGEVMRLDTAAVHLNWESVEREAYQAFGQSVTPGAVVYDVGAHFGTYAILAARQGGPGTRVVAYEPCEMTRSYLARHLRWNEVDRQVMVRTCCCGAAEGAAKFFFRPDVPEGTNGLLPGEGLAETTVRVRKLDDEVVELGLPPRVLKIDVEGFEWEVLKGAEETLLRHRPDIFVSLHPPELARQSVSPDRVLKWLEARGYQPRVIAEDYELHVLAKSVAGPA